MDHLQQSTFRKKLADYFVEEFEIFKNIKRLDNPVLFSPSVELPYNHFESSFNDSLEKYQLLKDKQFIIKSHPSDGRDYTKFFKKANLNFIEFTSILERQIPAEIILSLNKKFKYFGVISTILMDMKDGEFFLTSHSKELNKWYTDMYHGLIELYMINDLPELK